MQRRDLAVQEVLFRGSSGGHLPAGKFLLSDLMRRLHRAALLPENELKAACTGMCLGSYIRHIEANNASCAAPASPRPAGPLPHA